MPTPEAGEVQVLENATTANYEKTTAQAQQHVSDARDLIGARSKPIVALDSG